MAVLLPRLLILKDLILFSFLSLFFIDVCVKQIGGGEYLCTSRVQDPWMSDKGLRFLELELHPGKRWELTLGPLQEKWVPLAISSALRAVSYY